MTNGEFISRVSNQLRMLSKDDYISDRFVISVGLSLANKFISQKIQRRSINRDSSLYTEIKCMEFEKVDIFKCKHVEFKSCDKLSRSVKKIDQLGIIHTRYGSSIKEIYSIDRNSTVFRESTLYQLRNDSDRLGYDPKVSKKFYILDGYIYIPSHEKSLSALVLGLDQYEIDNLCECKNDCESFWEKDFIAPSGMIEDIITYTVQNILQTKQIPEDEKPNLNSNDK